MIKATPEMIDAVKNIHIKERHNAAAMAERVFASHLVRNLKDPHLTRSECIKMAGMAAAAEVEYLYA